ncbi:lipocalin [Salipiger sp. 1_MG-2023]|uniref:lipocalin n=1 Tax=Salipiger sp. 1_MG-2023 TaxID=3062665 RepID=UPI0026E46594|nr:lipocalin [Salipiger sp. 1_MG-2023]MDO6585797.1 lipocalin [Salipiger sp. 1_MG-2023]
MRALGLLLLLCACAAPKLPPAPLSLRDESAPIASQVDAALARLSGDWVVIEGAGVRPGARIAVHDGLMRIDGAPMPIADEGMGRFRLAGQPIWVHWIDADNRTAALGEPGGTRVWIMDRGGASGERLSAAREILTWYGYALDRMLR